MIRVATKTSLSSSTEFGDRTVKFIHQVVQVVASVSIAHEVSFPGGILTRCECDVEVIGVLNVRYQQVNFMRKNC